MKVFRTFVLCLILLVPALAAGAQASCGVPAARDDGWRVATADSAGLDGKMLCALTERFGSFTQANVHGVLVARRGALIFEQYFTGEDQPWGGPRGPVTFGPEHKHDLRSISKSVVSLLVGIAIDRKLIAGVDEPVFNFFPEHADLRTPEKDRILIRHALAMASGLAWDETIPYTDARNSEIRMSSAPDALRFVLEQPRSRAPGAAFNYSGGDHTICWPRSLARQAARRSRSLRARRCSSRLPSRTGAGCPTAAATLAHRIGSAPSRRATSPSSASSCSRAAPGTDAQLVSDRLDRDSIHAADRGESILLYGYQWWLGRSLVDRQVGAWSAGFGLGGQRLFVVPALDLVVVITAGLYASPMQRWVPWTIFRRYVVDAIRE